MSDQVPDQGQQRARRRERSPNYPGLPLNRALDRAQSLYEREGRHAANVEVVLRHWDYSPKSGSGLVTLAALKHFGLLEDEGSGAKRQVKLTPLALRIIQDQRQHSPEREESTKQAALNPTIHRELWDKYAGQLPSDDSLHFYLVNERGFTDSGAEDFIREFRETIEVARLSVSDRLSEDQSNGDREQEQRDMSQLVKPPSSFSQPPGQDTSKPLVLNLPLSRRSLAVIQVPQTVTPDEWDRLIAALETFKGAIVAEPDAPQPGGEGE